MIKGVNKLDSKYLYPESSVLINNFNIRDNELLHKVESEMSFARICQLELNPLEGDFNLQYLQNIHRYIFQDIYPWAGEIRTVNISKGNTPFAYCQHINAQSNYIFSQLKKENYLRGSNVDNFSDRLAYYASEINILHPFREGNGRATREFLRCLAKQAGYDIYYAKIPSQPLLNAFVRSVIDHSDLKSLFKNHFISNVKEFYMDELPSIQKIEEGFINDLIRARQNIFKGQAPTIKEMKESYKKLGKNIEKGLAEINDDFNLLSNIVLKIKQMEARNINQVTNRSRAINVSNEKGYEL